MQCTVMLVYGLYEEGYGVQFAGWKIFPHHNDDHFISGPNSLKVLQRRVLKSCGTGCTKCIFLPSRFLRGFSCKRIRHDMQLQPRKLITNAEFFGHLLLK